MSAPLNNIFITIATNVRNCHIILSLIFVIEGFGISPFEGTIQGEPTVTAIYAIEIILLVLMITEVVSSTPDNTHKMVVYADNFTRGGKIKDLNHWWKTLCELGPKYSYYLEASPNCGLLLRKKRSAERRHLRVVIESTSYKEDYINKTTDV